MATFTTIVRCFEYFSLSFPGRVSEMMRLRPLFLIVLSIVLFLSPFASAAQIGQPRTEDKLMLEKASKASPQETLTMLSSLIELQKNLKKQIDLNREKIRTSTSETEKQGLEGELAGLDRQLSDSSQDFERIATGVDSSLFGEKKSETFSWKDEVTTLVEPAIKEIKLLTARARQKTKLKDTIGELDNMKRTAHNAVLRLEKLYEATKDTAIKNEIKELLPEWRNTENRIRSKLELAQFELDQMRDKEVSIVKGMSKSIRNFLRVRGLYLIIAVITFGSVMILGRLFHQIVFRYLPGADLEKRPFHIRLLDLMLRVLTVVAAVVGLFFVLYQAEDWFLLSIAIIFFIGLSWTVRQTIPRLWQQARLMLNIGSVREGERLQLHGVPWKVETIHIFCQLYNPTLDVRLRLPIEDLIGLVSRSYSPEEPWFPCKKGDWVVVGDRPRARVVGLTHELVETIERGGKHYLYQTADFLAQCPINLSRNFRLQVVFGISYDHQSQVTTTIPELLRTFIEEKLEAEGYAGSCLNLLVEFNEAGASSLDLIILADFKGKVADIYSRLERAIQRWCVDAAILHNWEIPFPQVTFHWPARERMLADGFAEQSGGEKGSIVSLTP
jgi:hypothetical protein